MATTFKNRIARKAWKEIQQIQNADNMMTAESAISNGVLKTFGLWNKGLRKIAARKSGELEKFFFAELRREKALSTYGEWATVILSSYIPERLRSCAMYHKFISR